MKKNLLSGKLGTIVFYGVLFLIFLAPIFRLLLMSLKGPEGYSLANFTAMTQDKRTWEALGNTLVIAAGSTILATCAGTLMGFVEAYTNIRYKKPLELLVLLPFIIPSYIITLSWSGLLATQSTISRLLTSLGLPLINIYTKPGIIAVLGLVNTPIVYLSVIHTLRKIPLDMDWAARACGFSPLETLWKVDLKEALPAIISGSLLSFLACIDNFAVPAFLGISSNITVLSTYIYEKAIGFGPEAFAQAAALSVVLSVIALCGTVAAAKAVRTRSALDSIREGRPYAPHQSEPGHPPETGMEPAAALVPHRPDTTGRHGHQRLFEELRHASDGGKYYHGKLRFPVFQQLGALRHPEQPDPGQHHLLPVHHQRHSPGLLEAAETQPRRRTGRTVCVPDPRPARHRAGPGHDLPLGGALPRCPA